jgi:NAD(P)-dependent dehydrogenase (short-subunit alcohol dehydrogenase family)
MSGQTLSRLYRRAFVTGASSGIGLALVRLLLKEGVEVWGTSREAARLSALFTDSHFHPVTLDLGSAQEAEAAFAAARLQAGGGFDLVVLNAGFGLFGPFDELEFEAWEHQLEAMVVTTARLCHVALRSLPAEGPSSLVLVSSLAAELTIPCMAGYNMSKAALSALAETLMLETVRPGLRVIDFRPGDHRSGFNLGMAESARLETPRLRRIWDRLESTVEAGPPAESAAVVLLQALHRRHQGIVRTGGFFQAWVAPFFMSVFPQGLRRRLLAGYFRTR